MLLKQLDSPLESTHLQAISYCNIPRICSSLAPGLVAVFVDTTSGIGETILKSPRRVHGSLASTLLAARNKPEIAQPPIESAKSR